MVKRVDFPIKEHLFDKLIEFVEPFYADKDIMHNLSHIKRVLNYIDRLIGTGNYKVDLEIIYFSAYFHGFIYNNEQAIIDWLNVQKLSQMRIIKIIKVAWESQKSQQAVTLEGMVLHDAHMIEGGKTYLIVKSLITGSVRGQTLEESITYIEEHILDKGVCYLPEAEKLYKHMQDFAKEFILDLKAGLV